MAALKKKDDDMRAMEERYKMYLEKARDVSHGLVLALTHYFWGALRQLLKQTSLSSSLQVIRALDPKLNPATAEIQALKNQVADRDKQIVNLEVSQLLRRLLLVSLPRKRESRKPTCLCSVSVSRPG